MGNADPSGACRCVGSVPLGIAPRPEAWARATRVAIGPGTASRGHAGSGSRGSDLPRRGEPSGPAAEPRIQVAKQLPRRALHRAVPRGRD